MSNKQKHYALYDEQMNGFTFITGETKEEVAEYGADWWFDINIDSEYEDIMYKYDNHYEDIKEEYGELSLDDYELIKFEEIRKEDNVEYLNDRGFEIKEISGKAYDILNEIVDWHESRIHEYDLDRLCQKEFSENTMEEMLIKLGHDEILDEERCVDSVEVCNVAVEVYGFKVRQLESEDDSLWFYEGNFA